MARWPGDAQETLAGLRAALPPTGELVLESTPNGADGCFFEEWQSASATSGGESLVGHFFPWWWEPEYVTDTIDEAEWTEEERDLALGHGLSGSQIGFRRRLEAGFRGLARQEYAEDADASFLASGACVFDMQALDTRLKALGEVQTERDDGGELLVWNPPWRTTNTWWPSIRPAVERRETTRRRRCSILPPDCSARSCRER